MLVHVIRKDNQYDYIQDFMLEALIESNEIAKFKRGTGWVTIGTHPVRAHKRDKTFRDDDRIVINDDIFVREFRTAHKSSVEPF